jgi:putative transcriptional regulator
LQKKVKIKTIEDFIEVVPTPLKPTAGRILIAVPFFNDQFFNRSVVLLTDYDEKNCVGLILNKPTVHHINHLITDMKLTDFVFVGGPVMHHIAFGIHNFDRCKNASMILPNVYVGYDDTLISLMEYKAIDTLKYKFFVGYSGWSPHQLESELQKKMWVVSMADEKLILDTPSDQIWEIAVKQLGEEYAHWLLIPENIDEN